MHASAPFVLPLRRSLRVSSSWSMQPSAGCFGGEEDHPRHAAASRVTKLTIAMIDQPPLGRSNRTVRLAAPALSGAATPRPLLLGFHGQGSSGSDFAAAHSYERKALAAGYFVVHPWGIDTVQDAGRDTGWNVGTAGDESTCLPGTTGNSTHASCTALQLDGRCNWATCYDDVAFVQQLLRTLEARYCLDTSRYPDPDPNPNLGPDPNQVLP